MDTKSEIAPSFTEYPDRTPGELSAGPILPLGSIDRVTGISHADQPTNEVMPLVEKKQKTVKKRPIKKPSTTVAAMHAKEFAMQKRSILSNSTPHVPGSKMRAKTLLDQPLPTEINLKQWRDTDEFTKLAAAATPLYWMATRRGWELKTFTLMLSKGLSNRINDGDATALIYIRDQLTRLIPEAVGTGAEFLYGIEKAPAALANESSRRRWHLHGLIIGPPGFSATGKTPLRTALQAIKGEADSDLMFQTPGAKIEAGPTPSAMRWCFYAGKNGLSVQINPALAGAYDLPPGKQTFISAVLKREAKRWYAQMMVGVTVPMIIRDALEGLYEPAGANLLAVYPDL